MAPKSTLIINVLKLSMAAILAVWACIWIIRPTRLWKRSWHHAEDWASATFHGEPGLNVIVYCFPVMAVATLGYVYLYFYSRESQIWKRMPFIARFSNPVIIKSPIGMLSSLEILIASLFIIFLAWTYYSNLASDLKKLTPYEYLPLNRWQRKAMRIGIRFGSLSEACLVLLLLPILRSMALFRILGIQFEASVRYHIWFGNGIVLFSILHGGTIMFVWGDKDSLLTEITRWQRTGRVYLAGGITLATGVIIWLTSLPPIRRKYFQFFYFSHHLYAVFILFFLVHAGDGHFYLVVAGVLLFAIDKILRIIQSTRATHAISGRILSCKAVELTLPKHHSMKYTPTSTIFLKVPSISKFQWHPFSITSSSNVDDDRLSIMVKSQGPWTNSLCQMIKSIGDAESDHSKRIQVVVEGPYGPASFPYQRYNSLLIIAGGSGITPLLSILQDVASRNGSMIHPTKMKLIYVVKQLQDLNMLSPISTLLLNQPAMIGHLKMKLFVTQEKEESDASVGEILQGMSQLKTVMLDQGIHEDGLPRLKGLLWQATVTALTFILFLVSLVCLNHAFIYQEKGSSQKQKKKEKSPSWIGDLLVICCFIIAISCSITTATLASRFASRWWKTASDVSAPSMSQKHAKSAQMDSEKKIGSLEDHEIFFGKRPNFEGILSELSTETGESNIGVFVCGPVSMQEAVASFWRSYPQKYDRKQKCSFIYHSVNFSL